MLTHPPAARRLLGPVVACTLILGLGPPGAAGAPPPDGAQPQTLPSRVQALFTWKCAECHGAGLRKPKGKFGDVTNLRRVANDPRVMVPSDPDASKLWALVRDDEMPPEDARAGGLSAAEKETIRSWIAAGAPVEPSAFPSPDAASPGRDEESTTPPPPFLRRTLRWLGKFHVLVVHFPIALLLAAAAVDVGSLWRRFRGPWLPVRFCLLCGAAGAVAAAALGWLHADVGGHGAGTPEVLNLHRWIGTFAAAWAVVTAGLAEAEARRPRRPWLWHGMLWVGALLTGAAGHFGGLLVHGEDFFRW
jgi:mono/diheme cytochrome c family protein